MEHCTPDRYNRSHFLQFSGQSALFLSYYWKWKTFLQKGSTQNRSFHRFVWLPGLHTESPIQGYLLHMDNQPDNVCWYKVFQSQCNQSFHLQCKQHVRFHGQTEYYDYIRQTQTEPALFPYPVHTDSWHLPNFSHATYCAAGNVQELFHKTPDHHPWWLRRLYHCTDG